MSRAISYQLLIEVARPLRCVIGRLGEFDVPAGRYVYTGSAKRGIDARIARHLCQRKTLRWHIDYLIAAPGARVVGVARSGRGECALNRAVRGRIPVAGFGASDCSGLSETLVESELFGHESGAFTGAAVRKVGWSRRPAGARCFSTRSATSRLPSR